ncbi:TetR/AcrR family transcriptional regulator [Streptomyces sp. CA-250714]|uniref:TetR/AcrR family transcriptional regulator n=1 Tax=Streptomyces sp. CA-250714 TaxID=3240060 RepID=UPI003D8CB7FE
MSSGKPVPTGNKPVPTERRDKKEATALRRLLLDEAARVLAEQGPAALSARRLVKAVGASTMAVYTHFGSMPGLVREVIREGFQRFYAHAEAVEPGPDPVSWLAGLCRGYQEFARAEPDVYAVMFGASTLARFELDEEDRRMGSYLLRLPRDAIQRCAEEHRFRRNVDPDLLARQLFSQMHGLAQLTRAGYIIGEHSPDQVLFGMLRDFAVAAGDAAESATRSVTEGLRPR